MVERFLEQFPAIQEEGTALDPRFKTKVGDEVWTRLQEELVTRVISQQVFFVIVIFYFSSSVDQFI